MGKRSGTPETDEDLDRLTLEELNAEIARVQGFWKKAPNTYHRKSSFSTLLWLEAYRERVHNIPAPKRTQRARSS